MDHQKFFGASQRWQTQSERGYTMQTLIIIAILVLAATITFTVVYAVLRDSTDNIVGGSETFFGEPAGPQNLEINVSALDREDAFDIEISWDAPSYVGENTLQGYSPGVREVDGVATTAPSSCDYYLDIGESRPINPTNDHFSTSNTCMWDDFMVSDDTGYELVFTINVSNVGGFLGVPIPLDLSSQALFPQNVQTSSTENAIVVSWENTGEVTVYRFLIDYQNDGFTLDDDYLLCVNSSNTGDFTQEIPNIAMQPDLHESPPATFPEANEIHVIELDVSRMNLSEGQDDCIDNDNFSENSITFEGIFGAPAMPEFSVMPVGVSTGVSTQTLPYISITSKPCDIDETDNNTFFTFFWAEVGKPQTEESLTFTGCEKTLPVSAVDESEKSYSIWALATNDLGISQRSKIITWVNTGQPEKPAPPRNVRFRWETPTRLVILWDAPELEANALVDEYEVGFAPCGSGRQTIRLSNGSNQVAITEITTVEAYCIDVFSMSNLGQSSLVEIKTSPPPLGQTIIGAREVSVSWQATNPSEVSHYNAIVSSDSDCVENQVIFFRTVLPKTLEMGTILTETFPLLTGNVGYYICINAIYRNGNTERVFTSREITDEPEPIIPEIDMTLVTLTPLDPDNLELTGNLAPNDERYILGRLSYYLCFDILLPPEGDPDTDDKWNDQPGGSGEAEISVSVEFSNSMITIGNASVMIDVDAGSFTYSALEFDGSGTFNPIVTEAGKSYSARAWTSNDSSCPYPDIVPNAATAAIS